MLTSQGLNVAEIAPQRLELWGGVECTVNRVGDDYIDQLELNGHASRPGDLELFAELGVRALRHPVLWERTAPRSLEEPCWRWADERLGILRDLNIRPIVGFLHHGSGPRYTNLADPLFAEKLARYARDFAERFPWVDAYTPINEPLTTARFSGLYGHWYPHRHDDLSFLRMLLAQCRGVKLAMSEVRRVNPSAQLVQTEDLGKTWSTPTLRYQAEFENERRWLTFDLLCGRVCSAHPMWDFLLWVGIKEAELASFLDDPCPPDIIGINYYITSERFLDERLVRYPEHLHGGNHRHSYVDTEAVRVCAEGVAGARARLEEAWERYRLPLAITEAHLGCTREEQLRWLREVWDGASDLRSSGADVRAVTAWALLGAFEWDSLLTRREGHYEPGVFDVRAGGSPRPTALARLARALAGGEPFAHPALDAPGWWRRSSRLLYAPAHRGEDRTSSGRCSFGEKTNVIPLKTVEESSPHLDEDARPLLITGATGTLGQAFARICELRGLPHRLLHRAEMDIADAESIERALIEHQPWAVINTAGYVRVDDAETDAERCRRENTCGAFELAAACARHGSRLVTFSSDLVFDGTMNRPYVESDTVSPLNVYGSSKAEAERLVLQTDSRALVIRTSAFFGPWDEHNFVFAVLRTLADGGRFTAADDAFISPTYVPDLVHASLDLLLDEECGVWHLANDGAVTWAELARTIATRAGFDAKRIGAQPTAALSLRARRPLYSVLGSERGRLLPSLDVAIDRYFNDCTTKFGDARRETHASPLEELRKAAVAT